MKIAVASEGGTVFQHFGRTPEFLMVSISDAGEPVFENISSGGAGHGALVSFLSEHKVDVLICGGIGGGAMSALSSAGIKVVPGASGSAEDVVKAFLSGDLETNPDYRCGHHHGDGHSCGHDSDGGGCGGHSVGSGCAGGC